eukprot:m.5195 g.5195  ORF g.5195 m.5195 type:complete len:94 (+) comp12447_c0_seq1:26-307(+)
MPAQETLLQCVYTAWGLAVQSAIIGGIVGPLTMEKLNCIGIGKFTGFLYLGAGMTFASLLASVFIRPVHVEPKSNSFHLEVVGQTTLSFWMVV